MFLAIYVFKHTMLTHRGGTHRENRGRRIQQESAWPSHPSQTNTHIAWAREFAQAVQPFSSGSPYLNFLGDEGEARIRAAYSRKGSRDWLS
jgi:hypothetical protein